MVLGRAKRTVTKNVAPVREAEPIPYGVRLAAGWSWRVLAIAAVIALFIFLITQLRGIVIPLMVAILLAALLVPLVSALMRHRWPKWLAVIVAIVGLIAVVGGLVVLVVFQVRGGLPDLQRQSVQAFDNFKHFLLASPLHLTETDLNKYLAQAWVAIQNDSQALLSGALSVGSSAGRFLAGLLLTLFATIFLLIDGAGIWRWTVRLFPRRARAAVDGAGKVGWVSLTSFVRVQIFVAFVDAVGIGLGAWIIGLFFGGFPLVIPIAIAVFLGSFIPVVGAVLTGILAVFVALIYLNPFAAFLMLCVVIAVQQIEGHVLQPLVMGSAVRVHPLAVVFAVAAGSFLAGIPGALFAVPVVAVVNVMVNYIARGEWRSTTDPTLKDALRNV
ncbi:AI-2E family transporter [Parafrigoribacterium soli]|uniref:AI-2E family transporter n=1 Tax=Parafrigoribacterium soli TaxID=3144663 RepID=UPI0032EC6511